MRFTWETNTYRQIYLKLSQTLDPLAGQALKATELRHRGDFSYRKNETFSQNVALIKAKTTELLGPMGTFEELDSYFNIILNEETLTNSLYKEFLADADLEDLEKNLSTFLEKPFSIIPLLYKAHSKNEWLALLEQLKNNAHSSELKIEKRFLVELARTELFNLSNKNELASKFYASVEISDPRNPEKTLLRLLLMKSYVMLILHPVKFHDSAPSF